MTKKELRKQIKERNLTLTDRMRQHAAHQIFTQVEQLPCFDSAHTVALFCALPDEVPTAEAIERWSSHHRVVVPRVEGDQMQFYLYDRRTLRPGAFGIDEPTADATRCPVEQIDLIVVPGVAFTAAGGRMGRGRGYYDKYLAQQGFHATKVGIGYAHQLLDSLPLEPHDIAMEYVVCG